MLTVHSALCTLVFVVVTVTAALLLLEKHLLLRPSHYKKSKIIYLYWLFMPNTFCTIMFILWGCTPYTNGTSAKNTLRLYQENLTQTEPTFKKHQN